MGFLRRLLGGADTPDRPTNATGDAADSVPALAADDEDERAHELELARFEQDRTTELVRRQQRYSDRSWTPPPQGGAKRAGEDDAED